MMAVETFAAVRLGFGVWGCSAWWTNELLRQDERRGSERASRREADRPGPTWTALQQVQQVTAVPFSSRRRLVDSSSSAASRCVVRRRARLARLAPLVPKSRGFMILSFLSGACPCPMGGRVQRDLLQYGTSVHSSSPHKSPAGAHRLRTAAGPTRLAWEPGSLGALEPWSLGGQGFWFCSFCSFCSAIIALPDLMEEGSRRTPHCPVQTWMDVHGRRGYSAHPGPHQGRQRCHDSLPLSRPRSDAA
jgi:hypothetical protein